MFSVEKFVKLKRDLLYLTRIFRQIVILKFPVEKFVKLKGVRDLLYLDRM